MNIKELRAILYHLPDDLLVYTSYDHCCYGEIDIEQLALVDHDRDGNLVFVIAAHNNYRDEIEKNPKDVSDKAGIMVTDLLGQAASRLLNTYRESKGNRTISDVLRCTTDWYKAVEYGKKERDKELAKEAGEEID